ncbi:MAG: diol dehydratase reactivase, partial [Mycobacterium sp.]|nr:diol dehydratase reactivase [Mycobacterium sp.]
MTALSVVVAGVDVGNHTTEIVLARVSEGVVEQVAHDHAPTRGRKGSRDSLEGAAALLHDMEVHAGVAADELLLSALRPVDTATAPLPPPSSPKSPVRSLRPHGANTPAGTGSG